MAESQRNLQEAFSQWMQQAKASGEDPIVIMLQRIIQEASARHASDVHIQPARQGVEIRFRLDGVLYKIGELPLERSAQISSRIKVLSNLTTYKTDEPQEGRIRKGTIPYVDRDIRISTMPSLYGERIVARFFSEGNRFLMPLELGFSPEILRELSFAVQKTSGAILITGPAGNGKTTTTCALLRALVGMEGRGNNVVKSIVSLEDPIEYAIDGVAQMEITKGGETTLDKQIRYLMRQDPDVIMIGEIRDRPTAEAALQAALSGHLILSTFHASDTASALCRLLELGIEPFTIRSSVTTILCQRLVRRLCPCARKMNSPQQLRLQGQTYEFNTWYEPVGCPKCYGTGYTGRFLLAESLPLDSAEMSNAILDRKEASIIQEIAARTGMISLAKAAIGLIQTGQTSPLEVLRVLGG